MKLSDYVMNRIAEEGVGHVFMLPGGGSMHLVDSLGKHPELEYICNLHEQGVAIAVDAYAQVKGFGVGLVTTGPGGTNTLTGVAAAWLDSTPCMFISGQVKTADLRKPDGPRQIGFQEVDIISMVKPITKYAVTITDPLSIRFHLDRAIYYAKTGRPGPVWIDIPLDIQAAEIGDPYLLDNFSTKEKYANLSQVDGLVNSLLDATSPIIMLGNGVRSCFNEYSEFFKALGIPILLTWKAADFLDENDPLYAGRPGMIGQRAANWAQQECDFFLSIGARLDAGQTAFNHANFAPNAKKYIVDIDDAELNKLNMPNTTLIKSSAWEFLLHFKLEMVTLELMDISDWVKQIKTWQKNYPVILPEYKDCVQSNPYVLIDFLSELSTKDDIIVPGSSGACSEITHQAWKIKSGSRMLNSQGLGSMGFGVPAALGACIASGGKRTICIEGDGGFQMNLQELAVINNLNLPIKFIILDNGGYGSIRNMQKNHFDGNYVASGKDSRLYLPDLERVCEAYGIPAVSFASVRILKSCCKPYLDEFGPAVLIVKVPQDHVAQPKCISTKSSDGSMSTCNMENMWPFIERN